MIKQNWNIDTKEVKRILMMHENATKNLYLINEQNTSAVQSSTNSDEITLKGKSFFSNGKWKSLSPEGKKELDSQLANAAKFLTSKKGRVVYVKIIAGESQVTNTDNENPARPKVDPGYLSEKRATTMKEYLTKYFDNLVSQGIISSKPIFEAPEVIIGSEKYTKGIDNPNDEKYQPERFVRVELKLKSPAECVVGLTVEVMYNSVEDTRFPCRGDHQCNDAEFAIKLNGVEIGIANLNNGKGFKDYGGSRTSGKIIVTDAQAKQIIGNQSKDIVISLQCLSGDKCHSSSPEVKISKGDSVIYWGCSPSISTYGDTGDKTILVLDNCGNLKQKGTETKNKGEGEDKSNAPLPKLTGKTVEYETPKNVEIIDFTQSLINHGYVSNKPLKDGTYVSLKAVPNWGINVGDKIKVVKKNSTEKVPTTANIVTVKTINADTPQIVAKKFIDNKFAVSTDKPNVLKIVKDMSYNKVMYKPNQYITFIQG